MDEVDAQRNYNTSTEYNFRRKRRQQVIDESQPNKRLKSIDHNKTKTQLAMIGQQLDEYLGPWLQRASSLLSKPKVETGIPAISEINREGRKKQDKANLEEEVRAEKAKSSRMTRAKVTVEQVMKDASESKLSNDRVLRLNDARLDARLKIVQYTVVKFWKSELKLPDGIEKSNTKEVVKYTMRTAWQSFPYWHRIVHRKKDATPVMTKKLMDNLIGKYLSRIKATSKLILQFLYGLP
eukprot:scaffold244695_cov40-Cyclotella_meneghiniana.AAC.1